MLRVSRLTDYACVLMTCLAGGSREVVSAADLAERVRLELPTVSKLMKRMSRAGLVESFRGAQGGYRLARTPESISLADIVTAMEGPIGMTECSVHAGRCGFESHCGARSNWRRVSDIVVAALKGVTLADMQPPASLARTLRQPLPVSLRTVS
ncbi:MAG: SUF system Fe-S cluster assembly regulator [Lysobacterales bacterium]